MPSAPFRFIAETHEYIDLATGALLPHITGMLEQTGWVDDRWYTDACRQRGTAVHKLTSDFDIGVIDTVQVEAWKHEKHEADRPPYLSYLLAHVKAMASQQMEFLAIEQPHVHPVYHYGGRPDRVVKLHGQLAIVEIKSGQPEKGHPIQLALQALLVAEEYHLPAEMFARYALYLKANGKFRLVPYEHTAHDFAEARKAIKQCCNGF